MPLHRDTLSGFRPGSFEPEPLHIPAADPSAPTPKERIERARQDPEDKLPGSHVVEIDIS